MTEDDCFFFKYPKWQFSSQLWHEKLFVSLCCVRLTFWRRLISVVVEVGALKMSRIAGLVTGWDGAGLSWLWGCPPPPFPSSGPSRLGLHHIWLMFQTAVMLIKARCCGHVWRFFSLTLCRQSLPKSLLCRVLKAEQMCFSVRQGSNTLVFVFSSLRISAPMI